jgi:hypothetical protein
LRSWEWHEHRVLHIHSFHFKDQEGRDPTPIQSDQQSESQDHCPSVDTDHRVGLIASGIKATYVLFSGVLVTHGLQLVHLTASQHEESTDRLQTG